MAWQFILFLPQLFFGLLYSYGIHYMFLIDIHIAMISLYKDISPSISIIQIIFIILHRLFLLVQFAIICSMVLSTFDTDQQSAMLNQTELDMCFMKVGYLNLSNVLYKRLTQGNMPRRFIFSLLVKETFCLVYQVTVKFVLMSIPVFETTTCVTSREEIIVSLVFNFLCYLRFILYLSQRSNIFSQSDGNVMLAVDFIKDHFSQNKLTLVIYN